MDPAATSPIPASDSEAATTISRVGYFRWVICALLLFGTTKNYMDRQVLGVLKTTLQHDLGWNEIDYGNLVFAFQAAYAVGIGLRGSGSFPCQYQNRSRMVSKERASPGNRNF